MLVSGVTSATGTTPMCPTKKRNNTCLRPVLKTAYGASPLKSSFVETFTPCVVIANYTHLKGGVFAVNLFSEQAFDLVVCRGNSVST